MGRTIPVERFRVDHPEHYNAPPDDEHDPDATRPMPPPRKLPPVVLAIDIGGTKFAAGLVSPKGELIDRAVVLVDQDVGPEAHFSKLATIIEQQLDAADRHEVRIAAVGIGSAGPITDNCATVSPLNIPAWREFPLRERVGTLTGYQVYGDLDGKALALAEGWQGAAVGVSNYCVLTVSTGIGAGVVIDGNLLDGVSGNAGHVGHLIVEPNGRRCGCGARGCLEAEASGLAIEAITGRSPTEPTYEIMQRTGRLVGRGVASLCNLLDLDLVVVGGGVALGFAATFFNAAQEELSNHVKLPYSRQARITQTRLGDRGPLIGAGAIGIRGMSRARARRLATAASGPNLPT
jgi:glucokinase